MSEAITTTTTTITTPDYLAELKDLQAALQDLSERIQDRSKEVFHLMVPDLFKQNPILKGFRWKQYTPYFNDGDTCYFTVHKEYVQFLFAGDSEYEEMFISDERFEYDRTTGILREYKAVLTDEEWTKLAAAEAVREFLSIFSEDVLKQMFGDHTCITVTEKGVDVGDSGWAF